MLIFKPLYLWFIYTCKIYLCFLNCQYLVHYIKLLIYFKFSTVQFSSFGQLCLTLCDPMNCSTLGLPVHHQLLEPTQTHVHWVGDAIQPTHPLSSLSPPALKLSQHQGLSNELAHLRGGGYKMQEPRGVLKSRTVFF